MTVGEEVQLDGTESIDPDGDPLTYAWTVLGKPAGSGVVLDDPSSPKPKFTADKLGNYKLHLVVSDGVAESEPDTVGITAVPPSLSNPISSDDYQTIAKYGKSYLAMNSVGKKLLCLEGDAYQRGYAEGYLCPQGVYRMTHDFVNNFIAGLAGLPLDNEALKLLTPTARKIMVQAALSQEYAVPEEYRQEMRGIAEGAQDRGYDVTYEEVFLLNVGFDFLYSLVYQGGSLLCNEFSVFGQGTTDGRLYHGRDFMFTTGGDVFSDEALLMVHKPTQGYPFAASAAPGFVGLPTGMNSEGISFGMDMVPNRQNRPLVSGMGCLLVCREVVQRAGTMQEGIEIVRNTSRGVSWLFMIADGKIPDAAVLETVADRMIPEGDHLLATLAGLLPGLGKAVAGKEKITGVELQDGAGNIITGTGDLALASSEIIPVLGDVHPDRGVAVRASDYVDPEGLEKYRIVIHRQDPLVPQSEVTEISPFPLQIEREPGLVAMTNHYILPRMNLTQMGIFYHTIDTQFGGGRESEWRYRTMLEPIRRLYGSIDRQTAMWLIDFLNPARCDYYGTDTTQSVKGHHVLMDNHSLEMWSLHGYYDDPWQHVDLREILGLAEAPSPNAFPVASIRASATDAEVGEEITFDGSGSYDPDGKILSWLWDFGDGGSAAGKVVVHAYDTPGEYTVNITVMDDKGAKASGSCRIAVREPPPGGHILRNCLNVEPCETSATGAVTELADIFQVTDIHITDEDSPLRVEMLDPLGPPFEGAARPQEHLVCHALNSMVEKINKLHREKEEPFDLGPFDLVVATGDSIDNCQRNEVRWLIDVMDGKAIDPSSTQHPGLAFRAHGINPNIPWYVAVGNHDVLVQGNFPPNLARILWPALAIVNPGAGDVRVIDTSEFISEFFRTSTQPKGHGFAFSENINNGYYAFDPRPGLRFIVLNTVADDWQAQITQALAAQLPLIRPLADYLKKVVQGTIGGGPFGDLGPEQFEWMVEDIKANQDKLIFVFAHHPTEAFWDITMASKVDDALASYPNVVAYIAGHTHKHEIEVQVGSNHGFWKIETASLADMPSEGRAIEIRDDGDGTGSLILTCVRHDHVEFLEIAAADPSSNNQESQGTVFDRDVVLKFSIPAKVAQTIKRNYHTPGPVDSPRANGR